MSKTTDIFHKFPLLPTFLTKFSNFFPTLLFQNPNYHYYNYTNTFFDYKIKQNRGDLLWEKVGTKMRFGFILAHKVYNRSVLRIFQYKNKHYLDLKNYFKLFLSYQLYFSIPGLFTSIFQHDIDNIDIQTFRSRFASGGAIPMGCGCFRR